MKKYVSKSANFGVVLKNGIQGEAITGRAAVSGVYIRFSDGEAIVSNPEWIELMEKHPSFGTDFVAAAENGGYIVPRSSEPEHDIVEMTYGAPGRNLNPKGMAEQKTMLETAAIMAKAMATQMIKELQAEGKLGVNQPVDVLVKEGNASTTEVKTKKAGRPKKADKLAEAPYVAIVDPDEIKPAPKKELNPVREE